MIAFIHINKAAGTTIKYVLRRSFGSKHCDVRVHPRPSRSKGAARNRVLTARDLIRTRRIYPGLKSISGHLVTSFSDLSEVPNIRFYTFLRDPVKRTLSAYNYEKKFRPDIAPLEQWLQNERHQNVMTKLIAGTSDGHLAVEIVREKIGFVGIQEHYLESMVMLKKWIGDDQFDPRHHARNMADKKEQDELPEETRLALETANTEDRILYDYAITHVWPAQQKDYGADLEMETEVLKAENENFQDVRTKKGSLSRGLYWLLLPWISKGGNFGEYVAATE